LAIQLADGLFHLYKKSGWLGKYLNLFFISISRFTVLPIILIFYKTFLRFKIKIKHLNFKKLNYLIFFKKYLPGAVIVIIIISVTSNNILAKSYDSEEYANRTLLSNLVKNSYEQDGWNEIIEDSEPASDQININNYLEEQGSLQELVINTPFKESSNSNTEIFADSSSLVLITPGSGDTINIPEGQIPEKRGEILTYTVQAGDVISLIAEKFSISVNTLLWANDLSWNSTIKPGQKLEILPESGIAHEVKSGDNISSIAKKYQADSDNIISANKLADASDIKIGDVLFVPGGIKPTQVVSSYKPKQTTATYSDEEVEPAQNIDTGTKLLWPAASHKITQYYSWRHTGLDIGDKTGKPIYAAESGKVEVSGWNKGGYGNYVIINHGNGIKTLYAHASKLLVKAGDSVSRGDTIALIGSTGRSTGPHLHFEVRINDARKNPLNYIR